MLDYVSPCLALGQCIGRWGNFFNREAFGEYTNGLFAMRLPVDAVRSSDITTKMWNHAETVKGVMYIQVHPTYLYESICTFIIFLILIIFQKKRKYKGQITYIYLAMYSFIRAIIEGFRTDSLMFFGLKIAQIVSLIGIIIGIIIIVTNRNKKYYNEMEVK